jgi:hypothetical protein
MKSMFKFFAVLTLALAFTAPHAAAQSAKKRLVLKAPFSFIIENHEIPAGTYWITLQDGWLQMQTADGQAVTSVLTLPTEGRSNEDKARATFHRYGNRYFLSQVWLASSARGRQTLESDEEQRSRKLEAPQAIVLQLGGQDRGR